MASLDDEFARFEAELQSLEQQPAAAEPSAASSSSGFADGGCKKRAADDVGAAGTAGQPPAKKAHTGLARPEVTTTTVVASKPKVYIAPPRPAPVKKPYMESESSVSAPSAPLRPGVPNTVEDVAAYRGALSGFPPGMSGTETRPPPAASRLPAQPIVDMVTGQILSAEEQQMMNIQQSVYEYDPNRPVSSNQSGQRGGRGPNSTGGDAGKSKRNLRMAGGQVWEDQTLVDWPDNDFRLFCGDLGNEVSDEVLSHAFVKYPSFQRARVVRDKLTHKSRGYGFVSFADAFDCAKALREMNGKYIGNRPVKMSKSKWQDRNIDVAKKKMKKKNKLKHHLFN